MNKQHLRLKEFRTSLRWTQAQMVDFLNKNGGNATSPNYSNMESGTRPIPLDYIHFMHVYLKMSYEWFFHGKGRKKIVEEKERLTVTDIAELRSKIELITHKVQSIDSTMRKLHTDFYAHVANS